MEESVRKNELAERRLVAENLESREKQREELQRTPKSQREEKRGEERRREEQGERRRREELDDIL
jgi:hypothetical protein